MIMRLINVLNEGMTESNPLVATLGKLLGDRDSVLVLGDSVDGRLAQRE